MRLPRSFASVPASESAAGPPTFLALPPWAHAGIGPRAFPAAPYRAPVSPPRDPHPVQSSVVAGNSRTRAVLPHGSRASCGRESSADSRSRETVRAKRPHARHRAPAPAPRWRSGCPPNNPVLVRACRAGEIVVGDPLSLVAGEEWPSRCCPPRAAPTCVRGDGARARRLQAGPADMPPDCPLWATGRRPGPNERDLLSALPTPPEGRWAAPVRSARHPPYRGEAPLSVGQRPSQREGRGSRPPSR